MELACEINELPVSRAARCWQFVFFILLATAGMGAIGVALLAQPLASYYAGQDAVAAQQARIGKIQDVRRQQDALLANADNPALIERIAVSQFHYRPAPLAALERPPELPALSPQLARALAQLDQQPPAPKGKLQQFAETLARQPRPQNILLLLGAGLTVISLACFYRQR